MDVSERYIKMCDCPEIQEKWNRKLGDFYTIARDKVYVYFGMDDTGMFWLPRQDQLQDMILGDPELRHDVIVFLLDRFHTFLDPAWFAGDKWMKHEKYLKQFESMEQLWLAFVMHELYRKQWDDENKEWFDTPIII